MERKKLNKKKVGRPKGSISKVRNRYLDSTTQAQIAINQVDITNKLNGLSNGFSQMAHNFEDIITQVNKANFELAKRIQTLESRCAELDKLICKDGANTQKESDILN